MRLPVICLCLTACVAPCPDASAGDVPALAWHMPNERERTGLCILFLGDAGWPTTGDGVSAVSRFVKSGATVVTLAGSGLTGKDARRAVRIVRAQAPKRGIDPDRIGVVGKGANAKTALLLAMRSQSPAYPPQDEIDRLAGNVLFAVSLSPSGLLPDDAELAPDPDTCPVCLFQDASDANSPSASTRIYRKLRAKGIEAELHISAGGDTATSSWADRTLEFIRQMNYDGKLGEEVELMSRFGSDADRARVEKMPIWPAGRMPDADESQGEPFIEWHFPKNRKSDSVMIVYSGGCYLGSSVDSFEVAPVRRYLNERGMTAVMLCYRPHNRKGKLAKHVLAWQDLQRSVRIVRSQARERGLDPNRIGIVGFSAGGHLTLLGATSSGLRSSRPVDEIDRLSCAVQWAVAVYPAYLLTDGSDDANRNGGLGDSDRLVPELAFDRATCPVLFLHGNDDGYAAMGSVKGWERLQGMGIESELHVLAKRFHCFQCKAAPGTGSYAFLDRIWEFVTKTDR